MRDSDTAAAFGPEKARPEGMILITTLVVMLLVTILGAAMLFATRTELSTTTNYRQSMKAFNHADAVAQLAIRATDVLAYSTLEDMIGHLRYNMAKSDYKINDEDVSAALATFGGDMSADRLSAKRRYLRLGNLSSTVTAPDIVVRDKQDRVVGTITISHDFANGSADPFAGGVVGSSGGIADKGNTGIGGMSLQHYVITVSGKDPAVTGGQSFFLEDDEELSMTGPQSFITVLYAVVRSS